MSASFQLTTYALPVGVGPSDPNALSPNNTEDMRWHVKVGGESGVGRLREDGQVMWGREWEGEREAWREERRELGGDD